VPRLPPLHCLQALEAVARLGSVVAAADELCVTASAISHRLRQFEVWLGQPLIARPQPLTLTPHAVQYAAAARAALAGLAALPPPRSETRQRLMVAVPPTFARNILVPRIASFTEQRPDIELELHLTIPLLVEVLRRQHAAVLDSGPATGCGRATAKRVIVCTN